VTSANSFLSPKGGKRAVARLETREGNQVQKLGVRGGEARQAASLQRTRRKIFSVVSTAKKGQKGWSPGGGGARDRTQRSLVC